MFDFFEVLFRDFRFLNFFLIEIFEKSNRFVFIEYFRKSKNIVKQIVLKQNIRKNVIVKKLVNVDFESFDVVKTIISVEKIDL